jgi:hypothetical protein
MLNPSARLLAASFAATLAFGFPAIGQEVSKKPPTDGDFAPVIERGVDILLSMQESLGGSEILAEWPYEGVYRTGGKIPIGYRVGGTAIGAWSLLETGLYAEREDVRDAVRRGLDFVLTGLDEELMESGFKGSYDVRGWGHTYALTFLLRMRALELVPEGESERVDEAIIWLVETLHDTEIFETGGWNYARRGGADKSSAASPFMTAPTLLALYEARRQGEDVNPEVVDRALTVLENARTKDGAIPYTTGGGRDEMPGATGRTPITEVALLLAGRSDVDRVRHALDGFLEHWEWLEKRRRQTGTHVAPYGIAPYYFFYAHTYAALAIEFLPEAERSEYRTRFLARLFEVREDSGGWNDRVFERSENYGTAMSLLAILQPKLPRPTGWESAVATEASLKKAK